MPPLAWKASGPKQNQRSSPGNGRHEEYATAERHKQHNFKVMPVMLSELEPGIGPGKESESTTCRARILELDFWQFRRDERNKNCYFKRA
jgi:hypothetical protein